MFFIVDVEFELDDGVVPAHRGFLVAQCEVMSVMFKDDFLERSSKQVITVTVTAVNN